MPTSYMNHPQISRYFASKQYKKYYWFAAYGAIKFGTEACCLAISER